MLICFICGTDRYEFLITISRHICDNISNYTTQIRMLFPSNYNANLGLIKQCRKSQQSVQSWSFV